MACMKMTCMLHVQFMCKHMNTTCRYAPQPPSHIGLQAGNVYKLLGSLSTFLSQYHFKLQGSTGACFGPC